MTTYKVIHHLLLVLTWQNQGPLPQNTEQILLKALWSPNTSKCANWLLKAYTGGCFHWEIMDYDKSHKQSFLDSEQDTELDTAGVYMIAIQMIFYPN